MAVQILGLREYFDRRTNKNRKAEKFFSKNWRAGSVPELFRDIDKHIANIPEEERYNMYYTAASCYEEAGRKLEYQQIIPFDIDGIDTENYGAYIDPICEELGIDRAKTGIVMSGNGLQLLIATVSTIDNEDYFDEHRIFYKALCGKINQRLYMDGMNGSADTSVWSPARLLRLPNTENRKPGKLKQATMVNSVIESVNFDLKEAADIPEVDPTDQLHPNLLTRLPPPDTKGVQDGCSFLKYCKKDPTKLAEPQWYAMLSIIGRLEDGRALAHSYSKGHEGYSEYETDLKLDQSLASSGPRTCGNIDTLWDGCANCEYKGKINSPITIKSSTFIKTKDTGFHDIAIDANGMPKKGKPNYDDLMLHFHITHPFVSTDEGGMTLTYNDTHWEDYPVKKIHSFAESNFNPKPNNSMCNEFHGKISRNHIKSLTWFDTQGHINFSNGILDLETLELSDHTSDMGFKYALPFAYDVTAKCERFDQYLAEVTQEDSSLQTILLEYMGYSLSGIDPSQGEKALILTGEGSNGKSVFLDVLKQLAGKGNYSTLSMGNEINKLENRHQLDGRLFNISEETPEKAMMDSSIFKAMVTGGEVQARKLYCDAYSMKNNAKIIMACNELPATTDLSHGLFRRLLIIPFNATFNRATADTDIRRKLYEEASGIYNRAIAGLLRFKRQGGFSISEASEDEVLKYKMENDPIRTWFDRCVEKTSKDEHKITNINMFLSFKTDCDRLGIRVIPQAKFSKQIRRIINDDKYFKMMKVGGKTMRGLIGHLIITEDEY